MMLSFPPSGPPTSVATTTHSSGTSSASLGHSSENGSRVWVRQVAIDQATKPKPGSKLALLRRSNNASFQNNSSSSFNKSYSDNISISETESCTDHSSVVASGRQNLSWEWKPAVLLQHNTGKLQVRLQDPPDTIDLPADAWQKGLIVTSNEFELDPETGAPVPPHDLITLTHLHEPAVVESLQHRFGADRIYTSTGPVLLAVNPFQTLRGLYGETIQKKYWERAELKMQSSAELPPHVYAIADASFRNMMRSVEDHLDDNGSSSNQSILVSGESGAGKTVTTKFVMKYLAALSQRSAELHKADKRAYLQVQESKKPSVQRMSPSKSKAFGGFNVNNINKNKTPSSWNKKSSISRSNSNSSSNDLAHVTTSLASSNKNSIEAQVLQSNPILESFGNARTVRNDNSSRFGKFIEIQFTTSGQLVGAKIDTYLLEKVRLLRQSTGERNYHIFYELLSGGMSSHDLSQYFLAQTAGPEDFKLTCCSGTYDRRDGVSDQETYQQLAAACRTMKFDKDEMRSVFGVAAAILHASNLTFADNKDEASLDTTNVHLQPVCHLLGVESADLNEAVCANTIQAGKDQFVRRSLSVAQAEKGLEALLKTTYGALFAYLVQRINDSIAFKESDDEEVVTARPAASIGVLDIFGFESFHQNSFEQLCINYCNEALQQQFNAFVLKNEQSEYEREGIEWSFIEFPENQDVLDLIEKRGTGILSILDDQCRAPGPSDKAFCINLYNRCTTEHPTRFGASRRQTATLMFSVQHYAGQVEYTTTGFVEKNRDELPKETTEMLKMSQVPFVQELAYIIEHDREENMASASATPSKKLHRADSTVGRATVGGQFRRQLRDLRTKIDLTTPHYVRCIKPNDMLVPDHFDCAIVADQLKCGGILEAIRVARAGFTQHYPHADFVRRYRSVAWKELGSSAKSPSSSKGSSGWNNSTSRHYSSKKNSYRGYGKRDNVDETKKPEKTASESKVECKKLVSILYRKLQEDESSNVGESGGPQTPPPVAKAKTYNIQTQVPSWSKTTQKVATTPSPQLPRAPSSIGSEVKSNFPTRETKTEAPNRTSSTNRTWKRGGLTSSEYLKVGLQMGKTKVFLRHKCFETLERLRSLEQTKAATKLNSIFRRYLARIAYLPYRNAFRQEVRDRRRAFEGSDYDEKKESDYDPDSPSARFRENIFFRGSASFGRESLVDKWTESQIRDAIHNPVPRNEWGKQGPSNMAFLWMLEDGVWVKNYNVPQKE